MGKYSAIENVKLIGASKSMKNTLGAILNAAILLGIPGIFGALGGAVAERHGLSLDLFILFMVSWQYIYNSLAFLHLALLGFFLLSDYWVPILLCILSIPASLWAMNRVQINDSLPDNEQAGLESETSNGAYALALNNQMASMARESLQRPIYAALYLFHIGPISLFESSISWQRWWLGHLCGLTATTYQAILLKYAMAWHIKRTQGGIQLDPFAIRLFLGCTTMSVLAYILFVKHIYEIMHARSEDNNDNSLQMP